MKGLRLLFVRETESNTIAQAMKSSRLTASGVVHRHVTNATRTCHRDSEALTHRKGSQALLNSSRIHSRAISYSKSRSSVHRYLTHIARFS